MSSITPCRRQPHGTKAGSFSRWEGASLDEVSRCSNFVQANVVAQMALPAQKQSSRGSDLSGSSGDRHWRQTLSGLFFVRAWLNRLRFALGCSDKPLPRRCGGLRGFGVWRAWPWLYLVPL